VADRSRAPGAAAESGEDAAFPIHRSRERSAPANFMRRGERHALEQVRILVVDDDDTIRDALAEALEYYGAWVTTASSAATALERLRDERFDVVCSDLEMAGGSGLTLARAFRAGEAYGYRLPLVAVTGMIGDENELSARRAGFDAYVSKPVDVDQLARRIHALVESSRR
jgi:CheY-like chemotaxis protein